GARAELVLRREQGVEGVQHQGPALLEKPICQALDLRVTAGSEPPKQEKDVEILRRSIPEMQARTVSAEDLHADRGGRERLRAADAGAGAQKAMRGRILLRIARDHPESKRLPPIAPDALPARLSTESLCTPTRTVQVRHRVARSVPSLPVAHARFVPDKPVRTGSYRTKLGS